MRTLWFLCLVYSAEQTVLAAPPPDFATKSHKPVVELRDGDRVALVGATFFERDRHFGQFETMFRSRFPGRKFALRNLSWPGDTTTVQLRPLNFGSLEKHLGEFKPTVVFVSYGQGEAFEGTAGIERYLAGYRNILNTTAKTGARIVIVSPTPVENPGPPLPDPTHHNRAIETYSEATRKLANETKLPFVDLFHAIQQSPEKSLTENGLHYSEVGYAHVARLLAEGLGWGSGEWRIAVAADTRKADAIGTRVGQIQAGRGIALTVADYGLTPRSSVNPSSRMLIATNLPAGRYVLRIDGQQVADADNRKWASGVAIVRGPELEQVDELRALCQWKETLFFNRWRSHNGEYIYGRRSSTSQGYSPKKDAGNAGNPSFPKEMAAFDHLLKETDTRLTELSRPNSHAYELVPPSH